MMTFNRFDFAGFFGARSRAHLTALEALKELKARNIVSASHSSCIRLRDARALCDSLCQKAGQKLSEMTSHELGALLRDFGSPAAKRAAAYRHD